MLSCRDGEDVGLSAASGGKVSARRGEAGPPETQGCDFDPDEGTGKAGPHFFGEGGYVNGYGDAEGFSFNKISAELEKVAPRFSHVLIYGGIGYMPQGDCSILVVILFRLGQFCLGWKFVDFLSVECERAGQHG